MTRTGPRTVAPAAAALAAREIAASVRHGGRTAAVLAEEYLGRAAGPVFAVLDAELVRAEAGALDARTDRFALPLAGVPLVVEDGIDVAGRPNRHGGAVPDAAPALRDDPLVRRLRRAGALTIGTTHTAAPGPDGAGTDADADTGRGLVPAVRDGMAVAGIGVDGDGTLRAAAARAGLVALTPGRRVLPLPGGAAELWCGLAGTTVVAADVAGVALLLDVLRSPARPGSPAPVPSVPADGHRTPGPTMPVPGARATTVVCSLRTGRGRWAEPGAARAVHAAARRLGELGVTVRAADPPYRRSVPGSVERRRTAGVATRARELGGGSSGSGRRREHGTARIARPRPGVAARWRHRIVRWMDDHGAGIVVLPAPGAGADCLSLWNLAALPSLVTPVRWGGTRPSVQLAGRPGSEALLLATAAALES